MTREAMIARAEALMGPAQNFPGGDAARTEFDEILARLEATHPAAQPEIVRGEGLSNGHPNGKVRSSYAPSVTDDDTLLDDEPIAASHPDQRSAVLAQLDALDAAGAYPLGGIIAGGSCRSAGGLRTFVQACPHGFLSDVQVQLDAIAARTATTRPNTDRAHRIADDLAVARDLELIADAHAHAEYQNSDAGRHARLERLLSEIRDRLPEARR